MIRLLSHTTAALAALVITLSALQAVVAVPGPQLAVLAPTLA